MEPSNDIKWIALGQTLNSVQTGRPQEISGIEIHEIEGEQTITIPEAERMVAGIPIDADLAIFFIRKLWHAVDKYSLATIAKDTKENLEDLFALLPKDFKKDNDDFLEKKMSAINDLALKAENWLVTLLGNSFAITISKSMLLKTLSQPCCEGVRFYLCLKDFPKPPKDPKVPGILTLATVGVDRENRDLHYKSPREEHDPKSKKILKVDNVSFCSEYALTANRVLPNELKDDHLKPYVLYQYSQIDPDAK